MPSILNEVKAKVFQQEQLTVRIFSSIQEMDNVAAKEVGDQIYRLLENEPEINVIFAAAPSQNEFLSRLIHGRRIDWIRINAFHTDGYIGIRPEALQSFGHPLRIRIFDKVPFKEVSYPNDLAENLGEEYQRYADLLTKHPVDIARLGVEEDGHITFNDPDVVGFNDPKLIKAVELNPICCQRQVSEEYFKTLDLVPKEASTLTISALLKAERVLCIVPFRNKA